MSLRESLRHIVHALDGPFHPFKIFIISIGHPRYFPYSVPSQENNFSVVLVLMQAFLMSLVATFSLLALNLRRRRWTERICAAGERV